MIQALVLLCILPFAAVADWLGFIKRLPPLQMELTRASHGVVMVLAASWLAWWRVERGYGFSLSPALQPYILPFLAIILVWGLFWLTVGAARTRYYRDYHLIGRAAVKVALAPAIWFAAHGWVLTYNWQLYGWYGAMLVAGWCAITGLTKILLLLRPLPKLPPPSEEPYIGSKFGRTDGLK